MVFLKISIEFSVNNKLCYTIKLLIYYFGFYMAISYFAF